MATTTSENVVVWLWLPGAIDPVPAGVLARRRGSSDLRFRYGDRYRERANAIPLYGMPLDGPTWHPATENLGMPGAIRDASPDSWGRRVILQNLKPASRDTAELDEVTYLMQSGSDRPGALDFQASSSQFVPRTETATLEQLLDAAHLVEKGVPLPEDLERALLKGTAIGGARPKALLDDNGRHYIAKFSASTDPYDVVGAEAASIHLAARAGIPVTEARIVSSLGRKVLLLDRFDRSGDGTRRMTVSALTMLRLPETYIPLGSYPALLEVLLRESPSTAGLAEGLFRRAAFNIAIGNTDDHLRNHAAFWDGRHLELTPAYDLSPVQRSGETANQAIGLTWENDRTSSLAVLVAAAPDYTLDRAAARSIATEVVETVEEHWNEAADVAELTTAQRRTMWGRMFLNPGSIRGISSL